jgi:hypothetical protein
MSNACAKCGWPQDGSTPCFCGTRARRFEDGWCGVCVIADHDDEKGGVHRDGAFASRVELGQVSEEELSALQETQPYTSMTGAALRTRR